MTVQDVPVIPPNGFRKVPNPRAAGVQSSLKEGSTSQDRPLTSKAAVTASPKTAQTHTSASEKARPAVSSPTQTPAISSKARLGSEKVTATRRVVKKPSTFQKIFCCASDSYVEEPAFAPPARRPEPAKDKAVNLIVEKVAQKIPVVKRWIYSANTPKDQLPFKTWEEYHNAYRNRLIDIENPPLPPEAPPALDIKLPKTDLHSDEPNEVVRVNDEPAPASNPFQNKVYLAPRGDEENLRQATVDRLDLWGLHGPAPGTRNNPLPHAPVMNSVSPEEYETQVKEEELKNTMLNEFTSPTLEGNPAFKKIVTYARQTFGTKVSMITVLDDENLIYLAETGLGMRQMPRDINFCGHTVLSSERGLVALDLSKDWRFQENPLTTGMNARFYAGVPLLGPPMTEDEEGQAIGTLCVVDDQPRSQFSEEDRRRLQRLGELARKEVANWHKQRLEAKMSLMKSQLHAFHDRAEVAKGNKERPVKTVPDEAIPQRTSSAKATRSTKAASATETSPKSAHDSLPDNIPFPASIANSSAVGKEKNYWEMDDAEVEEDVDGYLDQPAPQTETAVAEPSANARPNSSHVNTFGLATRMIAKTLGLPLVYLVAVNQDTMGKASTLDLISAHGLPDPAPKFDAELHYKALTAPEGGLLYQNPKVEEMANEEFPSSGEVSFASAILVKVVQTEKRGYVLAGFASDPKRIFGLEDLDYLREMAEELSFFCKRDAALIAQGH